MDDEGNEIKRFNTTAEAAKASKAAAQITKSEADARYRVARATINESNAKNSLELSNARVKKARRDAALFQFGGKRGSR